MRSMSFLDFVAGGTALVAMPWGSAVRRQLSEPPMEYQRSSAQLRQLAGVTACSILPEVSDECRQPKKWPWGAGGWG